MSGYRLLILILFTITLVLVVFFTNNSPAHADDQTAKLWQVRSIDTMKVSRDNARSELNNPQYDTEIQKELTAIKKTGANYVAIDTPYDDEFLPYLTRWVNRARQTGLHVWFRGNWSSWEGWFDYPKSMTPDQHIQKNTDFITSHPDLFQDSDIFDPCPECENAGYWPQNEKNQDYNTFIQKQQAATKDAFTKIGKNVITNYDSIIGGRVKDVVDQQTLDSLSDVASIDHYISDPQSMTDYITHFANDLHTKTLVSEFGAPIPDLNGDMTASDQALFVQQVLERLYRQGNNVVGLNYWVLSNGTTELLNDDGSPRPAYAVVTDYFTPAIVTGTITDMNGNPVQGVKVGTKNGYSSCVTDGNGTYSLVIPPPRTAIIELKDNNYATAEATVNVATSGATITQNLVTSPLHPDVLYQIQLIWNSISKNL